jgi:dTDP-4-dehydrorhamnose 3,5-epimerase
MDIIPTDFTGVFLISPRIHQDDRGHFFESFQKKRYGEIPLPLNFVQDNFSYSKDSGTIRGLHLQKSPRAQAKLVTVITGQIMDVIVDLRKDSPTFKEWRQFELDSTKKMQLFVPQGFAHGFCTTAADTIVMYKVDDYYSPEAESGILWNDPDLDIHWPTKNPVLSKKDQKLPFLKDLLVDFSFN